MCGIAGIIDKKNRPVGKSEIKKITDIIFHRGPDGEGFLLEKTFALGHRRLAILDLSIDGNQPMWYEDKYSIVYNGEIYNYIELKKELEIIGYTFKTKCDTEVILIAYDCWGEECVNRFNGMWSFCIFNKDKNILFCSRDRFGIKPFYYFEDLNYFVFGSEIKQLLQFASREVNTKVLVEYLVLHLEEQSEETFFKDIKRLQPSHNLIYDLNTHKASIRKYYDLRFKEDVNLYSIEEAKMQFKSDFINSVKLRLRSDVKVGTCLSGGLDSSLIAAVVANEFKENANFIGIHAKSSEHYTDESYYAKMVADNANIDLTIIEPSEDYFLSHINKITEIQEEPISGPSLFMQYAVFEKANELGCKVMLDGQGGDETLLGYERYFSALISGKGFFRQVIEMFKYSQNSRLSFSSVIRYFFYFKFPFIRKTSLLWKYRFIKKEYLKILDMSILNELAECYKTPFELQKLEITKTQLPHLLRYEDKNSMAHSVEARLPFLDYKYVENALSFDPEHKIKEGWSKYILRKTIDEYLPEEISWRRNKRGFESPTTWLKNRDFFMSVIQKSSILKKITNVTDNCSDDVVWRLFSVAVWEERFNVKI